LLQCCLEVKASSISRTRFDASESHFDRIMPGDRLVGVIPDCRSTVLADNPAAIPADVFALKKFVFSFKRR